MATTRPKRPKPGPWLRAHQKARPSTAPPTAARPLVLFDRASLAAGGPSACAAPAVDGPSALPPFTHYAGGWLYGVWYCGASWRRATIHGAYPGGFVDRVLTMFPAWGMLHLCCGDAHIPGAVNVDLRTTAAAEVLGDAEALPFREDAFRTVLIDPPYSQEDAFRYGVSRLIRTRQVMAEIRRVLQPGGTLLWLDERYPSYSRKDLRLWGLIGIITGFERRTRVLAVWSSRKGVTA